MSTRMLTAMLCGLASVASAQTKISGTSHCNKPDVAHAVPAGDRPDHQFGLTKLKCTWSRPMVMAGAQMQQDELSVLSEINGNVSSDRAYVVGTLSSGDKVFVRPVGKAVLSGGVPQSSSGTWTYAGGTGKFRNVRGRGTFKCKSNADGTSDCDIVGSYHIPK